MTHDEKTILAKPHPFACVFCQQLGSGISEVIKFIRHDIALMAPCEEELTELGGSFATALSIKRGTMVRCTAPYSSLQTINFST